jgi:hypothetical protein
VVALASLRVVAGLSEGSLVQHADALAILANEARTVHAILAALDAILKNDEQRFILRESASKKLASSK